MTEWDFADEDKPHEVVVEEWDFTEDEDLHEPAEEPFLGEERVLNA